LFLQVASGLIVAADEAVVKVRALAHGNYGELHIGYGPSPSIELLPPAGSTFTASSPIPSAMR
jgi:hypothetical protein